MHHEQNAHVTAEYRVSEDSISAIYQDLMASSQLDPVGMIDSGLGSPSVVAEATRMRRQQLSEIPDVAVVSCDVGVLGIGEPPQRWWTKIGGVPYRKESQPWPFTTSGTPYTFICQFCFRESSDILPKCPGDVLLVFSSEAFVSCGTGGDDLYFEWQDISDENRLVDPANCLGDHYKYFVGYARPFRSCDIVEIGPPRKWYFFRLLAANAARFEPWELDYIGTSPARFRGIKIGGLPSWGSIDPDVDWGNLYQPDLGDIDALRFIGSIGSIFPIDGHPCPWDNQAKPLVWSEKSDREWLPWWDGFQVFFFLNAENNVVWALEID